MTAIVAAAAMPMTAARVPHAFLAPTGGRLDHGLDGRKKAIATTGQGLDEDRRFGHVSERQS
jgi:hypothetical protein